MSSKSTLEKALSDSEKNKLYSATHSICQQLIRIAPNLDDKGEKPLLDAFNLLIDIMYENNIKPSQILNEKGETVEDATSNQVNQSKVQEGTKGADAEMDMFEFINSEIQDLNRNVIEKGKKKRRKRKSAKKKQSKNRKKSAKKKRRKRKSAKKKQSKRKSARKSAKKKK